MLFNVQLDDGGLIVGYMVPDEYHQSAFLLVFEGEELLARISCDEHRPGLVESGRHATGLCGFTINDQKVPHLAERRNLRIVEEETGVLVYRRKRDSQCIQSRVFRLETHLFPLWGTDEVLEQHFTYFHKGIERYGSETSYQIFQLDNVPSLYVSGRLPYKQYFAMLDKFTIFTLLHEPHYELAERLMTLKHVAKYGEALMSPRELMVFQPAIDFAAELNVDALQRAFANMPSSVIPLLSSPIARQFSAETFDAPKPRGAVATALANLSHCMLVGVRERVAPFTEDLEHMFDLAPGSIEIAPMLQPVQSLANRLQQLPEVEVLLEADLDIYANVKAAVDSAYEADDV